MNQIVDCKRDQTYIRPHERTVLGLRAGDETLLDQCTIKAALKNDCRAPVQDATGRLVDGIPPNAESKILLAQPIQIAASHEEEPFGFCFTIKRAKSFGSLLTGSMAFLTPSKWPRIKLQGTLGSKNPLHNREATPSSQPTAQRYTSTDASEQLFVVLLF